MATEIVVRAAAAQLIFKILRLAMSGALCKYIVIFC
jgi:hypothetical protein